MDSVLDGLAQFPEVALDWVQLGGRAVAPLGVCLPPACPYPCGPRPPSRIQPLTLGTSVQVLQMRAISSSFMFFYYAYHSCPIIRSIEIAI